MSVSNEPLVWLPFSGGGMLAALFVPVHVVLLGLAIPLGWVDGGAADLAGVAASPLVQVYLLVLVAGCLAHAAHRLRYLLVEVGLWGAGPVLAVLCYGGALLGTAWAAWIVFAA